MSPLTLKYQNLGKLDLNKINFSTWNPESSKYKYIMLLTHRTNLSYIWLPSFRRPDLFICQEFNLLCNLWRSHIDHLYRFPALLDVTHSLCPSHIVGQKSSIIQPPRCGFTSISLVNHVLHERLPQQLAVLPNKGLPQLKLLQLLASVGASALHLLLLLPLLLLASQAHTDVVHDGVGRPGHLDRHHALQTLPGLLQPHASLSTAFDRLQKESEKDFRTER